MSRGTTRSTRRLAERRHPSTFFFVALAIGLALLIWLFVHAVRHPTKPQAPARRASVSGGMAAALQFNDVSSIE